MTIKRVKISKDEIERIRKAALPVDVELLPDPVPPGDCVAGCERNKHFCGRYPDPVAEGECCRKCNHYTSLQTYCFNQNCPCHTPKEEKCKHEKQTAKWVCNCGKVFDDMKGAAEEALSALPPIEAIAELSWPTDGYGVGVAPDGMMLANKLNEVIRALNRLQRK